MVRSDQEFNAFQIVRPVMETTALRRFLGVANYVGNLIFRNDEPFELVEDDLLAKFDARFDSESEMPNGAHGVGVAEHAVYGSHGLKVVLLDRRSPKNYKAQPLLRAYTRFSRPNVPSYPKGRQRVRPPQPPALPAEELRRAALKYDIPSSDQLTLSFSSIVPVYDPANRKGGIELALVPDPTQPEAQLVYEEAGIVFDAFQGIYRDLAYPTSKVTQQVSFGRTPDNASPDQVGNYIKVMQSRIPLRLVLDQIQPKYTN